MKTQQVPFVKEDLPLGPCGCGEQLAQYEREVGMVRDELGEKVRELEMLRG